MTVEIITKQDLEEFRVNLLEDIKQLLGSQPEEPKKWLKSYQVRNLLKISPGTLQNLRINGTLSYSKVGSIFYYKYEDIQKLLDDTRKNEYPTLFIFQAIKIVITISGSPARNTAFPGRS